MPGPLLLLQGQVTTPTVEFLLGKKKNKKNLPPTLGVTDNYGLGPSDKTQLFTLFFFQAHQRSAKLPFFSGEALLFFLLFWTR